MSLNMLQQLAFKYLIDGSLPSTIHQRAVLETVSTVFRACDELPENPEDLELDHVRKAEVTGFSRYLGCTNDKSPAVPPAWLVKYRAAMELLEKVRGPWPPPGYDPRYD